MDTKTTVRKDHNISPKPSTSSVVNSLIQTKDEVHTKLLEETKKTADLNNTFSTLDEQLRASIEKTLRNLKTELEKQRKRLLPGIRRLEDASKSLKKSEIVLEGNDGNYHKNADIKKAARRIKDAKRVVQEFLPSNPDLGIHSYIADQITQLCQRIRQIPLVLNDTEFKNKYNIPTDKSIGSSSDSLSSQKTSPPTKARRVGSKEPVVNKGQKRYGGHTNTLNGVEMFSSDSETLDEDFETGQYIPIKVKERGNKTPDNYENGESIYAVIGDESQQSAEYLTPLQIRKGQQEEETGERTRWRQGISSTSTPNRNSLPFATYTSQTEVKSPETKSEVKYITTRKPLPLPRKAKVNGTSPPDNRNAHIPLLPDKNIDLKYYAYSKAKNIPKRLLPSVPKSAIVNTNTENPYSTVANNDQRSEHLINGIADGSGTDMVDADVVPYSSGLKDKQELRDIEELQFKESVETCRQNIIDRLKERYTINPSYRRTPTPEMGLGRLDFSTTFDSDYAPYPLSDNEIRLKSDTKAQPAVQVSDRLSRSLGNPDTRRDNGILSLGSPGEKPSFIEMTDRVKSPNTHWSKLVIINSYSPTPDNSSAVNLNATKESGYASVDTRNQSDSDSIVTKAIMKFENTVQQTGNSNRYTFPKSYKLKKSPLRPRSTSAEGVPMKTTRYRHRSTSNLYALAPRSREPIQTSDNSLDTSLRHMGSIEIDLDKLCNESNRSIRQEWSQRRSQSLQNTPKTSEKTVRRGPSFAYHSSFRIPDHKAERCHISSIVVMTDGKIVILDQRHRYLYSFDRHYTFLSDCPILEFPGGMATLQEDTIAIAYPYKSKTGIYRVASSGTMHFKRDIFSPCSKWVNGIGFAKGHLYLLCKGGDVHIMTTENTEIRTVTAGMNGKLLVHPSGRRFYIIGEGRITKFGADGAMLSSMEHIGAYSLLLLNDALYAVDRQKHMIVSVKFGLSEEHDLIGKGVEYPAAVCVSATGEQLLVSQFEESIDIQKTRTIHVYKLESKPTFP